jgi:hypothetical protein
MYICIYVYMHICIYEPEFFFFKVSNEKDTRKL